MIWDESFYTIEMQSYYRNRRCRPCRVGDHPRNLHRQTACYVDINATVEDRNGEIVYVSLVWMDGLCAQPEMGLEQPTQAHQSPDYVRHEVAGDPTSPVQYINFSLVNDGI